TRRSVLVYGDYQAMRMLQPFTQFISDEIWLKPAHKGASITVAQWPEVKEEFHDEQAAKGMERLVSIIKSVRNIRAEVDTPISKEITLLIQAKNDEIVEELKNERAYLERFCNPSELVIATELDVPEKAMSAVVTGAEIFLPLEGLIDFDKEIERLEKELDKWTKEVDRVQKKLANKGFVTKAPEKIVAEEKQKEKDYLERQANVRKRLQ